jgi:hypothetical protein
MVGMSVSYEDLLDVIATGFSNIFNMLWHCRAWINHRDFFFTYKISIRSRTGKDTGITSCDSSD